MFAIILLYVGLVNSKAIPEEPQRHAGGQKVPIPKGWETGGLLYNPRTDGRPIYVPPMLKSDNLLKDLLDYYKPIQSQTLSTPQISTDKKENIEDKFDEPILHASSSKKAPVNRINKNTKVPDVKINMKQKNGENFRVKNAGDKLEENYDEPILSHSKKTQHQNKSINAPQKVKAAFQPNLKKNGSHTLVTVNEVSKKQIHKTGSLQQTESIDDYDEPLIQHASKKQVTNLNKNGSKNTKVSTKKTVFELPVVSKSGKTSKPASNANMKQVGKNLKTVKAGIKTNEFEEPILRQSSKKSVRDKNNDSAKIDSVKKDQTEWDDFDAPKQLKNLHKGENLRGTSTDILKERNKDKFNSLATNKQMTGLKKSGGKNSDVSKIDSDEYDEPVVRETSKFTNKKQKPIGIRDQRGKFTSERPSRFNTRRRKHKNQRVQIKLFES